MDVTAVIVNYNTGQSLVKCVASVIDSDQPAKVIVIDNASIDDSIAELLQRYPDDPRVNCVRNADNIGFAAAVNQGLAMSESAWLLILNPDCILSTSAIGLLRGALERDDEAVLAGAWVINPDGSVQRACRRSLPDPARAIKEVTGLARMMNVQGVDQSHLPPPEDVLRVEAVSGACMLVKTAYLKRLDGLDPGYKLHCEDLDLMQRIRLQGWWSLLVPDAIVTHQQGVSSRSRPLWVEWQKHLGMLRFHRKFYAKQRNFLFNLFITLGVWGHFLIRIPGVLSRS